MKKEEKSITKKSVKSIFLICILSTLIFGLVGCSSMGKYEDSYNDYEKKFEQIILSENNKNAYDKYMENFKSSIENKKSSDCDQIMKNLDELLEASKSYSIDYLNVKNEEMNQKATQVDLLEPEESAINDYEEQIKSDISDSKYKDAASVYDKYSAFLDGIIGSNGYSLEVSQVDVSEYPNVKLYVSIKDESTGESIDNLEYKDFYISEKLEKSTFKETKVEKAVQLDQEENLNIDIVADVSDSMNTITSQGTNMEVSKRAMVSLVNQIQFNVGDKAGLMSFADGINRNLYFTDDKSALVSKINSLQMGTMTSLYDALYASINQIATSEGAKCVIAFTDGMDTNSQLSYQAVKDLAQRYKIPVYIIGIGNSFDSSILQDIANSTGGFYRNITDASYMAGIYEDIFREQKSQYLIEYKTSESSKESVIRNLYLRYMSDKMMVRNTYSYRPQELLEVSNGSAKFNQGGYIFGDSDSRYLTIADLEKLTTEQLRIARNEIYARCGRKFDDNELQKYFNGCSWYNGRIDPDDFNEETMFNNYEYTNVKFIKQYEEKLK